MKGNLTRRGERSWRLKFDAGRDPATGKRATRYLTLKGSKAEAQREAAKILGSVATGQFVDPDRVTVGGFCDRWMTEWATHNISGKTRERYGELLRTHIKPRLGLLELQKLKGAHLQSVYSAMATAGSASRTVLHVHRLMHRILRSAVQWGLLVINPAAAIDAPSVRSTEIEILNAEQLEAVLTTLRPHPFYALFALLVGSGCRRGEALALRWNDLDLDKGTLRIERSVEETKAGLTIKPPKTHHGNRLIGLAPATLDVLREYRIACQQRQLKLGRGRLAPDALIFGRLDDGGLLSPRAVSKAWRLAVRPLGITVSLHTLRHTHASSLIAAGLDVLQVARRLGHGSASITLDTYGHLFKQTDDRAVDALQRVLTTLGK
jgi:integrase